MDQCLAGGGGQEDPEIRQMAESMENVSMNGHPPSGLDDSGQKKATEGASEANITSEAISDTGIAHEEAKINVEATSVETTTVESPPEIADSEEKVVEEGIPVSPSQDPPEQKPSVSDMAMKRRVQFCKLCKSNRELPSFFMSHVLQDEHGIVQCPVLRGYICSLCGATGDNAHTIRYCPRNPQFLPRRKRFPKQVSSADSMMAVARTGNGENSAVRNASRKMQKITRTAAGGYAVCKF